MELVFDPFDLGVLEVRRGGAAQGLAVPLVIGPHVHPKAQAAARADQPPPPPAIDYLAMAGAEHRAATRRRINYAALTDDSHHDSHQEMP